MKINFPSTTKIFTIVKHNGVFTLGIYPLKNQIVIDNQAVIDYLESILNDIGGSDEG